jgi:amino acid transporter
MSVSNNNEKVLGFFDVALMTFTGSFGIRWLAVAAGIGPASFVFWLLGALFFLLPLAIVVAQLAKAYPEEGGIYSWTRIALGEKSGFMVAWLYWVNNIFFYPAILIFLASNFSYFIGHPELANNQHYITVMVLIAFWLAIFSSLFGLKISKYVVNLGGIFGSIFPALILIVFAAIAYFKFSGSATKFNFSAFIPSGRVSDNLSSLSILMFAMAGVEVIPTFANKVKNVRRDLYLGLLCGSLLLFALYVLGTFAINVVATPAEVQKASGVVQAVSLIDAKFGINWLTKVVAFLLTFAELAAITLWLVAPVVIFFKCTPAGILPRIFHKVDKHGTPINALLFQGVLVSVIIIATDLLPSVNSMYQILILMSTVLYFIPYLYLAMAYLKSAHIIKIKKYWVYIFAYSVLLSVLFGILISFAPTPDLTTTKSVIIYESELLFGPFLFIFVGWWLYRSRRQ